MIVADEELRQEVRSSKSFLSWSPGPKLLKPPTISFGRGRSFVYKGRTYKNCAVVDERHYTPAELAEAWGVSSETIRQLFRDEPGVIKLGDRGTKYKRSYLTLRIPQSVAERVHQRISA